MVSYLAEVWRCRYFWLSLVKMDLQTRYRRSVLGIAWSLLHPLAMTVVLSFVFHKLVAEPITDYAPFVLAGLAFWNYFVAVVLQGCNCFMEGEAYIRQHPAPLAIYPLRTTLGAMFHFVIALFVVLILTWYFKGFANLQSLPSLVPVLLLLFLFGWATAILAGLATVYFRDVRHITEVGLQILFYASPIIYRSTTLERVNLGWLVWWNPAALLMNLIRDPIIGRDASVGPVIPTVKAFSATTLMVLLLCVLASLALARLRKRLVFHL